MVFTHTLGWGQRIDIVPRNEWGARKPDLGGIGPSRLPFSHVIYRHSGSTLCKTRKDCARAVRTIQADQIEGGAPDIHYNFMIGSDGLVYKCRGWFFKPTLTEECVEPDSTVAIGFIGDFQTKNPPLIMSVTAIKLIKHGLRRLFLKPSFKLTTLKRPVKFENTVEDLKFEKTGSQ